MPTSYLAAFSVTDCVIDVVGRFNGVFKSKKRNGFWRNARIEVSGKDMHLGRWRTEEKAAWAYDCAAMAYRVRWSA